MSRTTPRKSRHRHHPSSGGIGIGLGGTGGPIGISDYESDAALYLDGTTAMPQPPPLRTNTELNLSVLRRYQPDVRDIVSIAANAVVYTFSAASQSWDKTGAEGTLFVCELEPSPTTSSGNPPGGCIFILNRRGLDNIVIDLAHVSHCEVTPELTIFKMDEGYGGVVHNNENGTGGGGGASSDVVGVWMHADEDDTREVNAGIIHNLWQQVRTAAEEQTAAGSEKQREQESPDAAVPGRGGKRISLTQLFAPGGHGGGL